jgi:hypothetical protein
LSAVGISLLEVGGIEVAFKFFSHWRLSPCLPGAGQMTLSSHGEQKLALSRSFVHLVTSELDAGYNWQVYAVCVVDEDGNEIARVPIHPS